MIVGDEGGWIGAHGVGSSLTVGLATPRKASVVVVSVQELNRSDGTSSEMAAEGATLVVAVKLVGTGAGVLHWGVGGEGTTVVVAAKVVGLDAGVRHMGVDLVAIVDVNGIGGDGVTPPSCLSKWGS